MKKNTNTTSSSSIDDVMSPVAMLATEHDLKDALLMASLSINLFVLSLWVAMQVTTAYDAALMGFFFGR
jgi:hypothetical protein